MSDEKKNTNAGQDMPKDVKSIADFLEEKKRLLEMAATQEKAMEEQYKKLVTIMFTDIKGSTSFYEKHGDLEGRMMVEQHNSLLFPIVQEFGGTIIKTVGDAIMAKYAEPAGSVRAAVKMQQVLREYRARKNAYPIHVRIGVNYGYGMVEATDVFGDVVNCSARIESLADGGEILISGELYEQVRAEDDIIVRFREETKVKGKEEPVKVYRVIWNEDDLLAEEAEMTKTGTRKVSSRKGAVNEVLEINASREGDVIKIGAGERLKGQHRTVSHYEEVKISNEDISKLCHEVTNLLNRANKRGKISKEILKQLREIGGALYDRVLPPEAKAEIKKTKAQEVVIHMDDKLVQIPWELLFDGQEFLCLRFAVGRIVSTKQKVASSKARRIGHPLRMLVLADPRGDLPASSDEGRELRTALDSFAADINVHLKNGQIKREFVDQKLRNYDIVHYAGHADYDPNNPSASGWLIEDGKVTAADVTRMGGGRPMPAMVFSNACQSGQTEEWKLADNFEQEIYGLANAFLLSGVQHYVGTFWEILDAPSQHFSSAFYKAIMEGESVGLAVRAARQALIQRYGDENIVWASYMLYGDPSFTYHHVGATAVDAAPAEDDFTAKPAAGGEMPAGALRSGAAAPAMPRGPVTMGASAPAAKSSSTNMMLVGGLVLILALGGILGYQKMKTAKMADDASVAAQAYGYLKAGELDKARSEFTAMVSDSDTAVKGHEGLAALALASNDFQTAEAEAQEALKLQPANVYAKVVLGNLAFNKGDMAAAENLYKQATESTSGEVWQKSEAFNRLGRVYAASGDMTNAVASYGSAIQSDPSNTDAYANQGKAFERMGKLDEAVAAYKQGAAQNPGDGMTGRLLANAMASLSVRGDQARMEGIRSQVKDLSEAWKANTAKERPAIEDTWTSRPMDIAFVDFVNKGNASIRDGENEYLLLKIIDKLQEGGKVQVVEREMLGSLLTELQLSAEKLTDKETALKVGKLVGARMISTGSLIRYQDEVQVSLRFIETETSRIPVSVTETFPADVKLDQIADKVSAQILEKIGKQYPIQAKVINIADGTVTLNVGSKQGLEAGAKFDLVDDSTPIKNGDQVLGYQKKKVGAIEVTQVEEKFAMAKVLEGTPAKDMKVARLAE